VLAGFQRGLNTCPSDYNSLKYIVNTSDWTYTAGKGTMSELLVAYPKVLGVATCDDTLAAGAVDFWIEFNNGQFAAGLFVAGYGANPLYSELVASSRIQITIDPLASVEGAGLLRAFKFAALAFLNDRISATSDLVLSPVWPRGKYLKQKLKKVVLDTYSPELRPSDGGREDFKAARRSSPQVIGKYAGEHHTTALVVLARHVAAILLLLLLLLVNVCILLLLLLCPVLLHPFI
jgi:hypothetical protein